MDEQIRHEQKREEAESEGTEKRLQRRMVLVVDDDPDLRDFVRQALEPSDYRVKTARDGREALAVLADEAPDVVLLDIRMPRLSGEQVLERLQSIGVGMPPIIIMTAGDRARDLALETHNPLYLPKPFDATLLLATVETALGLVEDLEPEYDA